ncbi:MAG: hypothetical protein J5705_05970 [Bacteroidaceae bacterium]|nr:hypothetical protein [Bacteroidaceae bacterium]
MRVIKKIVLLLITVVIISCDCILHIQGVVVDSETQKPIQGVLVKRTDISFDTVPNLLFDEMVMDYNKYGIDWDGGSHGKYTDNLGYFEFTYITGALFRTPKIPLSFEKDGYIEFKKRYKGFNEDTVIVVLKKTDH